MAEEICVPGPMKLVNCLCPDGRDGCADGK